MDLYWPCVPAAAVGESRAVFLKSRPGVRSPAVPQPLAAEYRLPPHCEGDPI